VIALVAVELRRFLARRLMRVIALLAVAAILVAALIVFFNSSRDPSGSAAVQVVESTDGMVSCYGSTFGAGGVPDRGQTAQEFCDEMAAESASSFGDDRFHLASLDETWLAVGGQMVIIAWLIGASFAGAEWHTGSMTTLLTWEPRRARVFMAKLAALLILVYLGSIALEILIGLALWPAAALRGTTTGVDAAWIGESAALLGRVGLVCCVGASLGYGLAMVGRNTAASLGVGFGYLIIIESLIRGFRPQWSRWLFVDNSFAFLAGSDELLILGRPIAAAGAVTVMYGAVALFAGWALFRRRDVT
jgi:hypothetical protein